MSNFHLFRPCFHLRVCIHPVTPRNSICLIVFSLLSEFPHDAMFYWKCVPQCIHIRKQIVYSQLLGIMFRMRAWIDLLLMSLTFFLTIIWNVEIGILVSVVISLLLVVRRSSRPRMTILVSRFSCTDESSSRSPLTCLAQGRIPGTDRWKPIDEDPEAVEDASGVLIVRIRENLDFGAYLSRIPFRLLESHRSLFLSLRLRGFPPSEPSDCASIVAAITANTAQLKGVSLKIVST